MSDPDAPPLDPDALIGALERHKVSFVAVGGLAAQWRGAQRQTKDLDVCPAWERENLDRLAQALRELGGHLRGSPFPEGVVMPLDGTVIFRMEIGTWRTDAGDIDILLGIPRDSRWDLACYEQLRENATLIEVGEHTILVAALEDIIRSKEIADRPPDREALPELRRLSAADPGRPHGDPDRVRAGDRVLELGGRAWLMGIVNASPDSFSDGGRFRTLAAQVGLARELLDAGADILDIGGESASTGSPPVAAEREIERVVPLIERVAGELGAIVSVDTYKPAVARAAIAAGATIVNDVSGLRDPALAEVCARSGAALVLMHTRAAPKQRLQDPDLYGDDVVAEVLAFLGERIERALAAGVAPEQLILDPGPDFSKTPAQTIRLLADVGRLHELGRPLLMAISRKDFIGALTGRPPGERLAGTLAALAHGVDAGAQIFRVHDVVAAADFLKVRAALAGALEPQRDLALAEEHRYER